MDQKAWPWRKKSAEKNIASTEKMKPSFKGYEEQAELVSSDKSGLETDYRELNNKLAYAISDCDSKDDLLRKHERVAQEAIAGREKAESESMSLKKHLDESFKQRIASEERIVHLDLALKECAQQLRCVREDQERRIHDVVTKTSKEFEKSQSLLEEKLHETSKRLAKVVTENAHLSRSLLTKEKSVEDLRRQRGQVEADFNTLMSRFGSLEKENGSLRYEVRILEKELEIRNEEREFNRRLTCLSHKQHLESVKRIARLETECQRLRILVKKRLPGSVAMTKMKNEAEVLGFRKKSNAVDLEVDRNLEIPARRINSLMEQLVLLGEENKNLRESASKKTSTRMSHERSVSDLGSDDKASCAESWVSGKFGNSDINLMDDFAEMERLAVISVDETPMSQTESVNALVAKLPPSLQQILELVMRQDRDPDETLEEIKVALQPKLSSSGKVLDSDTNKKITSLMDDFAEMERLAVITVDETPRNQPDDEVPESVDALVAKLPSSLQRILNMVLKQQRDPDDILEEIKFALEPKIPDKQQDSDTNKSVSKIIDLIEGISFPSQKDSNFYSVRVFQWKSSELSAIMQRFLHTCYDLLTEKSELSKFAEELWFALDWILNHCFSLQDVSSMREEIMNCDEHGIKEEKIISRSQCEALESTVDRLMHELEESKNSKKVIEAQLENYRSENADLGRELSLVKAESNEARENLSSMEVELEKASLELELQLQSVKKSEIPSSDFHKEEHKPKSNWEITAASEKLAECQETIFNLSKELKALASPKQTDLIDNPIAPAEPYNGPSQRASLLHQMLAEDNAKAKTVNGKQPLKGVPEYATTSNGLLEIQEKMNRARDSNVGESSVGRLAIVSVKNEKSSRLWRKLWWKRRKGSSKKPLSHN